MSRRLFLAAALAAALAGPAPAPAQSQPAPGCLLASRTFQSGSAFIPNAGLATSSIQVAGLRGQVADVDVQLVLQHPAPGELDITVTSPDGRIVTLTTDNGPLANGAIYLDGAVFDDQANPGGPVPYVQNTGLVTDHLYNNVPAQPLYVAPEEPLAVFNGGAPEGTWTLTIDHDTAGVSGTLVAWLLTLRTQPAPAVVPAPTWSNLTPVAIGSGAPSLVTSEIVVPAGSVAGVLSRVRLQTRLRHTRPEDLDLALRSPAGTWVTLSTDNGGANDDVFDFTVWDDAANAAGGALPYAASPGLATDHPYQNGVPAARKTGALVPSPDQAVDGNWEIVAALDFDHDNNRDLLWYNTSSGKIVIWFLDQQAVRILGKFTDPPNAGDANWRVVAAGDYGPPARGDQLPDIVWRNATSGRLVIWHMNGSFESPARLSGTFTSPDRPEPPLDWTVVGPK